MGFDRRNLRGRFHVSSATANAGTAIVAVVPPRSSAKTVLSVIQYESGSTAHTLQVLRAQGSTTTTASAAANDSTITLDDVSVAKDLNGEDLAENLAASDYLVVEHSDGSYGAYSISSINTTTKVVTLSANLSKAVDSGASVWAMHEISRSTGIPSISITTKASTIENFPPAGVDGEIGIASSTRSNEPLLIYSNNASNAGTLKFAAGCYTDI